jgi:hypothetical protein
MPEGMLMGDAAEFLGGYQKTLETEVAKTDLPPQLLELFQFESCLKHKDGKEVYLVVDRRTGGKAILRATRLDGGDKADAEYEILRRLDYPGIPKTFGSFTLGSRSYIVREYFAGQPLDEVIAQGTMGTEQILGIARRLCEILGYLHAQTPPVIHRDIKPQNIILMPNGSVGLTDFGIARVFKPGSDSDTQYVGTMPYAPPEQYGYAQSTGQTDIYALGIVLIYLATGSPNRQGLAAKIPDAQLLSLIEKCIAFDPAHRFETVEQIVQQIVHPRISRRTRVVLIVAAALAAVLLVLGGLFAAGNLLGWFPGSGGPAADAGTGVAGESSGTDGEESDLTSDAGADAGADGDVASAGSTNSDKTPTGSSFTHDPEPGSTYWLYDYNNSGNLDANINNGGYAVGDPLYRHELYIADDSGLYALDEDGTVLRQLSDSSSIGSLNFYKDYLYYVDLNKVIKLDLKTGEKTTIIKDAEFVYFEGGRLYYTNTADKLRLYTAKNDGSSQTMVSDASSRSYRNIVGNVIYSSDEKDAYRVSGYNMDTQETTELTTTSSHWLSVCNGKLYYHDGVVEGGGTGRVALDGTGGTLITNYPYDFLVATPRGLFALDCVNGNIVVLDGDGNNKTILVDKKCGDFCVTEGWLIYENRDDGDKLWMVRLNGEEDHAFEPT